MAEHLVVKHTFWELETSPEEWELSVEECRNRAYTDMCIEYRIRSGSMDFCSPISTAVGSSVGSSVASSNDSATGSASCSEAGDVKERWADIADDNDDVPTMPTRPAGTWFVPASPMWFQKPCMPENRPLEAPMAVAVGKAKARAADSKTARAKGKAQTVERQPQQAKTSCNDCDRTTLVFRKLPTNVTRTSLLDMLDAAGFRGLYDFVYLPVDFKKGKVFGYAIVNFVTNTNAEQATLHFGGVDANIHWSDSHQGFDELIQRYRDSPIMQSSMPEMYKPVVLSNGKPVPFPQSTTIAPYSTN